MPKQGSTTSFVADAIALDFLNSAGTLENEQMDWILDGEGRLGWLAQAKLVPADVLVALRRDVQGICHRPHGAPASDERYRVAGSARSPT
jgi:hypothetical protein